MTIRIDCPECREPHKFRDDEAGRTVRCKECRTLFDVPHEDEPDDFPKGRASGGGSGLWIALTVAGCVAGVVLLVCGGVVFVFWSAARNVQQAAARQQVAFEKVAAQQQAAFEKAREQNALPSSVESSLTILANRTDFRRHSALGFLGTAPVDPSRRAEVVAALQPLLDGDDLFFKQDARIAFARWAGSDEVPRLIELVKDDNIHVNRGRVAAIEALGRLKDRRALPALREAAKNIFVQTEARKALAELGETP